MRRRFARLAAMTENALTECFTGDLPQKALSLVKEWASMHQSELAEIWDTQQFRKLPPLI
jgi:hypothetical protein